MPEGMKPPLNFSLSHALLCYVIGDFDSLQDCHDSRVWLRAEREDLHVMMMTSVDDFHLSSVQDRKRNLALKSPEMLRAAPLLKDIVDTNYDQPREINCTSRKSSLGVMKA